MTRYYVFNGDADGLCALQQLRLVERTSATLVTGVKRDIHLLRKVTAGCGDEIVVLDVSFDENRDDVERLLRSGASIRYFDHHHAGDVPSHPSLETHIREAADVCTSSLVDEYLDHPYRRWAAVAAFGDNLPELGRRLAQIAGADARVTSCLELLGLLLNYNAYGARIEDLIFHPALLAGEMLAFADPEDFATRCSAFTTLKSRYESDLSDALSLAPTLRVPGAFMIELPDEPWARRVVGVAANSYTQREPDSAIAIAVPDGNGSYTVSVRVPAQSPVAADEFCRRFPGGNGRKRAAGINRLTGVGLQRFAAEFEAHFRTP